MLQNIENFLRIESLDDAIRLLKEQSGCCAVIAGGTSLLKSGNTKLKTLIKLTDPSLFEIKVLENSIFIGSHCVINDIFRNEYFTEYKYDMFYDTCLTLASEPLRNIITLGGNVYQVYPWSNFPVLLSVIDNAFAVINADSRISINDLYKRHPKLVLKPYEIITSIEIPVMPKNVKISFMRLSKTAFDYSLVSAAVNLKLNCKVIKSLKISIGAVSPVPFRLYAVEEKYLNRDLSEKVVDEICSDIIKTVKPNKDYRVSSEYKKEMCGTVVKKILNRFLEA